MLKSNFKKWLVIPTLFLLLVSLFVLPVSASVNRDYTINDYDVHVKVNQNNVLDITETINADFLIAKHGINRDISVVGTINLTINGQQVSKTYKVSIKNISVTDKNGEPIYYETSRNGDNLEIKIGNENETFTGMKDYVIKYSYDIGSDGIKQFDELYYNLIGNSCDTTISNVTFTVDMPKEFDKSLLNFTSGAINSTDSSAVKYDVSGNTITGSVNKTLQPGEGVTVRLELPDQYFTPDKPEIGIGLIVLFTILSLLSIALFLAFGRDAKVYETVEVSPPDDITSAEAGYIIDGHVDNKDIVSLIIYWADKGYLSIHSDESDNFTLIKCRNADNAMRSYEKLMFNDLFEGRESVTTNDLQYKFSETLQSVKADLINTYNTPSKKLFTTSGNLAKALCYIFAGLCMGTIIGKAIESYTFSYMSGLIAGAVGFVGAIIVSYFLGYSVDKSSISSKVGLIFLTLLYMVLFLIIAVISSVFSGLIIASVIGAIAAIICGIFGSYSKKRTAQSTLLLGKLLGLRKFINMAEKSRIEMMVQENPSLFYNILPYAYVLGVTDKWAKKFENIVLAPPSWYSSEQGSMFNAIYFATLINLNMNAYQENMVAVQPSNTSGFGGIGGGGFSGGGFGGGGVGSW